MVRVLWSVLLGAVLFWSLPVRYAAAKDNTIDAKTATEVAVGPVRLALPIKLPWSVSVLDHARGRTGSLVAAVGHGDRKIRIWSVSAQRHKKLLATAKAGFHLDSVRWLDWDGDGRRYELLVSAEGKSQAQIWRYHDGTLRELGAAREPDPARIARAADVDGNGFWDFVLGPYEGDRITVLWGSKGFKFTPSFLDAGANSYPTYPAFVDWNRDGRPDIVWSGWRSGDVRLALNLGDRKFRVESLQPNGPGSPRQVAVADINGDGWPDLVVAQEVAGAVKILYNDQEGGVGGSESIPLPVPGVSAVAVLGCGPHSLLALSAAGKEILAKRGTDGKHWLLHQFPVSGVALDPQFSDVDGDGHADLVYVNAGGKSVDVVFGPLWAQTKPVAEAANP